MRNGLTMTGMEITEMIMDLLLVMEKTAPFTMYQFQDQRVTKETLAHKVTKVTKEIKETKANLEREAIQAQREILENKDHKE